MGLTLGGGEQQHERAGLVEGGVRGEERRDGALARLAAAVEKHAPRRVAQELDLPGVGVEPPPRRPSAPGRGRRRGPGRGQARRGFSGVDLLAVDEAARVPDELYYAIRPMLAVSQGRLVALSTPFGTRGWWYEAWRSPEAWERYQVPAADCPRISADFLDEERRTMGEWWFQQEYDCEFLDAETQPFSREDIERAFEEEVEAWNL